MPLGGYARILEPRTSPPVPDETGFTQAIPIKQVRASCAQAAPVRAVAQSKHRSERGCHPRWDARPQLHSVALEAGARRAEAFVLAFLLDLVRIVSAHLSKHAACAQDLSLCIRFALFLAQLLMRTGSQVRPQERLRRRKRWCRVVRNRRSRCGRRHHRWRLVRIHTPSLLAELQTLCCFALPRAGPHRPRTHGLFSLHSLANPRPDLSDSSAGKRYPFATLDPVRSHVFRQAAPAGLVPQPRRQRVKPAASCSSCHHALVLRGGAGRLPS